MKVRIIKGGTIGSTGKEDTLTNWPELPTFADITYGSSSDLWGETWTYSDINASGFGIALSASITNNDFKYNYNAFIDCFKITVDYTESGGSGEIKKVESVVKANVKKIGGKTAATVKKIGGKTF